MNNLSSQAKTVHRPYQDSCSVGSGQTTGFESQTLIYKPGNLWRVSQPLSALAFSAADEVSGGTHWI